jgi:hypothetical protein
MNLARPIAAVTTALMITALAACGTDEQPTDTDATTSTPIVQDVTPTETDEPTEPEDTPTERVVPSECAALTLDTDVTYTGQELGACVATALASFGSGRMDMIGTAQDGTASFTYDPDYNFQVVGTSDGGPLSIIYTDGTMWVDTGNGWVKGDPESDDPTEQMAGVIGELYRVFSDPAVTADLIAATDGWTSDPERALRTLPTGDDINAVRITNDEPFTWQGFQVQELILWYGDEWVPVGTQATSSIEGLAPETVTQEFYDLGADIEIAAPTQ